MSATASYLVELAPEQVLGQLEGIPGSSPEGRVRLESRGDGRVFVRGTAWMLRIRFAADQGGTKVVAGLERIARVGRLADKLRGRADANDSEGAQLWGLLDRALAGYGLPGAGAEYRVPAPVVVGCGFCATRRPGAEPYVIEVPRESDVGALGWCEVEGKWACSACLLKDGLFSRPWLCAASIERLRAHAVTRVDVLRCATCPRLQPGETTARLVHVDKDADAEVLEWRLSGADAPVCRSCRKVLGEVAPSKRPDPSPPPTPEMLAARARLEALRAEHYEDTELAAARLFTDLTILHLIGRGGMGSVWAAAREDGTRVAIKLLRGRYRKHPEYALRFEREIEFLRHLDHPNIVRLLESRERDGVFSFVMEHVEGESLRTRLARGALPRAQALHIAAALADALAHVHHSGILHRDLKPENILLTADGTPKLIDFGVAKLLEPADGHVPLTRTGTQVGTPEYLAPEIATQGREVDGRADLYALGVILFEMLAGALPEVGEQGVWPLPAVDPELDALLSSMVAPAAADRLGEPEDVAKTLRTVMNSNG